MGPPTIAAVFTADPEGSDRLYTTLAPVYDLLMRDVFDYGEQSAPIFAPESSRADRLPPIDRPNDPPRFTYFGPTV